MRLSRLFAVTAVLGCMLPCHAAPVYGTSAPLVGSSVLSGSGDWTLVTLGWNISQNVGNPSLWDYNYTLTNTGSQLSHLVLEFSQSCANDPGCITNGNHNPDGPRLYAATSPPNFELPASIYGVKFDGFGRSPNTFSFTSNRAPIYGDVYARDGGNGYAFNAGITNHASENIADFVARPNGPPGSDSDVPESSAWVMMGIGLGALAVKLRT